MSRRAAAVECDAGVRTVGKFFRDIEKQIGWEYIERLKNGEDGIVLEPERMSPACKRLRRLTSQSGVMREMAVLAQRNMTFEQRMEEIFQLCILDDLRDMISRARVRLAVSKGWVWQSMRGEPLTPRPGPECAD